jgi:hypothetical protein
MYPSNYYLFRSDDDDNDDDDDGDDDDSEDSTDDSNIDEPLQRFVISRIIGERTRNGEQQYLVLWRGYREEDATLEEENKLSYEAIQHFENLLQRLH